MRASPTSPRIAIVHEWFTGMRGGEKCVEALCEVFPEATLFALLRVPGSVSPIIERMPLRTSFIQHLPFAATQYRRYLPLFPAAVQRFDLRGFDIVISSNHCVAKGVCTPSGTLHICYCHTPMRYIWHLYDDYFGRGRAGLITRLAMGSIVEWLRAWDVRTAANPDFFVANSENVRNRIREIYHRDAEVIYPPVDTESLTLSTTDDGFFLIVTAMVPYKRVDLAIRAFTRMNEKLVIVGNGPDMSRLRALAGPSIDFKGWQSDQEVRDLYARCSAVVFPGEEDFGIVPVEAMACGKPVIAYAKGGALETVIEHADLKTGVLFREQTVDALMNAVGQFRREKFDPKALRGFAQRFDREIYKKKMAEFVSAKWNAHRDRSTPRQERG
jgi:glycosyltransferase involved in cell wall biosynthesis